MFTLDLEEVKEFISKQSQNTKIYIGCDSERLIVNNQWYADYILAIVVHIDGRAYPLPVGATPRAETAIKESSPAEPSPGNKAAQKPVKKTGKPKTARASGSTGRKRLAG